MSLNDSWFTYGTKVWVWGRTVGGMYEHPHIPFTQLGPNEGWIWVVVTLDYPQHVYVHGKYLPQAPCLSQASCPNMLYTTCLCQQCFRVSSFYEKVDLCILWYWAWGDYGLVECIATLHAHMRSHSSMELFIWLHAFYFYFLFCLCVWKPMVCACSFFCRCPLHLSDATALICIWILHL